MPTLMLRQLSRETLARVKSYARARALSTSDAAGQLLTIALDHLEARTAGATIANQRMTPAERSANAKRAIAARWAKQRAAE